MNEMYYQINRRLKDPLYDAKCTKRQLNKEIKKCRQTIEDYSISIGFHGKTLSDLLRKLDEVNERIEKLEEGN